LTNDRSFVELGGIVQNPILWGAQFKVVKLKDTAIASLLKLVRFGAHWAFLGLNVHNVLSMA